MKKPKISKTLKEVDLRIAELREAIEEEKSKIVEEQRDFIIKKEEIAEKIRIREMTIEEYALLLKHYQQEREDISNPSSRNGRNGGRKQH
jgi:hypothetical protein